VRPAESGFLVERLDATVPVSSLNTGMGVRDDHMRKYVFTAADGNTPDLRFVAENVTCAGAGRTTTCPVVGQLAIRGVAKPFDIVAKIAHDGNTFRVAADGVVKLSTYGIEPPSQLGVHTEDAVKLHLEFAGSPSSDAAPGGAK
jgi:polyisoprenoid-binding protein YceI